jgi:hypothetical protein
VSLSTPYLRQWRWSGGVVSDVRSVVWQLQRFYTTHQADPHRCCNLTATQSCPASFLPPSAPAVHGISPAAHLSRVKCRRRACRSRMLSTASLTAARGRMRGREKGQGTVRPTAWRHANGRRVMAVLAAATAMACMHSRAGGTAPPALPPP